MGKGLPDPPRQTPDPTPRLDPTTAEGRPALREETIATPAGSESAPRQELAPSSEKTPQTAQELTPIKAESAEATYAELKAFDAKTGADRRQDRHNLKFVIHKSAKFLYK